MLESVTVARPYAQAVFLLAREAKALDIWSNRLQRLVALTNDPDMERLINHPNFSVGQVAELLISLSGEPENQQLTSFVGVLAENERLGVLSQILEIYEQLKSRGEGVKEAAISSAYPLDETQLKHLMSQLEIHFGSRLEPRVEVDATLIGGVRVAVGDRLFDTSVRGKLEAMAAALKN